MIYHLTHITSYDYTSPVSLSHHILRLSPRAFEWQQCLKLDLNIHPAPGTTQSYNDFYGNETTFVTVEGAHRKFVVSSHSLVDVKPRAYEGLENSMAWNQIKGFCESGRSETYESTEALEFLFPTAQITVMPEFREYAKVSFPQDCPVAEAVMDLTARIHADFKFDSKATTIATPLDEVFKKRKGVCQDFAQFQIACLRSMNVPARYVSGYLETDPPPGKPRLTGSDASHAWVSFYAPGQGWVDVDPTNNIMPTYRHITLAWGRDFHDVSPIRGVILGGGDHSLKVSVDVVRQHKNNSERDNNYDASQHIERSSDREGET